MVATVTDITTAGTAVHYFERDGYYAKGDDGHRKASRWYGRAAELAGRRGHVDPKRFGRVLRGHVPRTDIRLGRLRGGRHEHRPGPDITLSAPKSVSLAALVDGDGRVVRAHDLAVCTTLDFVESRLPETRGWDPATGRCPRAPADGLVAATFRQIASRNLAPPLHTHCVVANMTWNAEGEWRSIEATQLRRAERLIGAHYRNELARRLRELGYGLREMMIGDLPGFEIEGYGTAAAQQAALRTRARHFGTSAR